MAAELAAILDEEQVHSGSLVAARLPDGSRSDVELVAPVSAEDVPAVPAWSAESLPDVWPRGECFPVDCSPDEYSDTDAVAQEPARVCSLKADAAPVVLGGCFPVAPDGFPVLQGEVLPHDCFPVPLAVELHPAVGRRLPGDYFPVRPDEGLPQVLRAAGLHGCFPLLDGCSPELPAPGRHCDCFLLQGGYSPALQGDFRAVLDAARLRYSVELPRFHERHVAKAVPGLAVRHEPSLLAEALQSSSYPELQLHDSIRPAAESRLPAGSLPAQEVLPVLDAQVRPGLREQVECF